MDTPGRRACRFIQLKTRPHYTAGGEAGHGDFLYPELDPDCLREGEKEGGRERGR